MKYLAGLLVIGALIFGAYSAQASHSSGYKWRGNAGVEIRLVDEMPASWATVIQDTVDNWNQSSVIHITREVGSCEGEKRIICVTPFYDESGTLATNASSYSLDTSGPFINSAVVNLNTYWLQPLPDYVGAPHAAACHEIGHALGLADYSGFSCMATNLEDRATIPGAHDFMELEAIY